MNEENKQRQVIMMSLAALLIGILLFIFGLSISSNIIPLIINYFIALLLYFSSFLATYRQHQQLHLSIYKYLMFLSVFFIILSSIVFCVNLF